MLEAAKLRPQEILAAISTRESLQRMSLQHALFKFFPYTGTGTKALVILSASINCDCSTLTAKLTNPQVLYFQNLVL